MEQPPIIRYLKENYPIKENQLDNLQYTLTEHLYFFGNHFRNPREVNNNVFFSTVRNYIRDLFIIYKIYQNRKVKNNKKVILSNSYFSVNHELKDLGYQVYCPSWVMSPDKNVLTSFDIFKAEKNITRQLRNLNFNELISQEFLEEIEAFANKMMCFFLNQKISALFVPADVEFFSNLSIQVSKKMNIPSFIFLHGLPHAIVNCNYNRSDYLIVWGEKTKEHYIKEGMNPQKIFISGHPMFKEMKIRDLKFGLENIIVLTKGQSGTDFSDRSNAILYLYSLQSVLKRFGVMKVNLRPHPGENPNWYLKYIDTSFFKIDVSNLKTALQKATLMIGPTSSVLLETVYNGINYTVYEPTEKCDENIDLLNRKLLPPFDGSDPRVPVAKDETELEYIIKNRLCIETSFFSDYSKIPFDLSFVKKLI